MLRAEPQMILISFSFIHKRMLTFFTNVLFIALSLTAANSDEPVYRAVGDKVELKPGPVSDPITIITWKHRQNIAMEWFNGSVESFRQFKERGDINGRTGALTITGLTPGDSGNYTAEINHKETRTTQLQVISRVSKPTVSKRCDRDSCVFTCESDTTNAEPVTYSWISQEKSWVSRKELRITKEESETWFHCELSNPVSTEISETVQNPFSPWKRKLLISCILLLILVGVVYSSFSFVWIKQAERRRNRELLSALVNVDSLVPVSVPQYVSVDQAPGSGSVNHTPTSAVETEALVESSQDPESDVFSETRSKDDVSPDQVLTNTQSTDIINETEFCGESNQEPTADADPESSSQTDIRASPDQVLTDATSEAEESSRPPQYPRLTQPGPTSAGTGS